MCVCAFSKLRRFCKNLPPPTHTKTQKLYAVCSPPFLLFLHKITQVTTAQKKNVSRSENKRTQTNQNTKHPFLTCGSKPRSNILSASSSTRNVTRLRFVTLPLLVTSKSIIRPGVHTTISVPCLHSLICLATPPPPYTAVTRRPTYVRGCKVGFPSTEFFLWLFFTFSGDRGVLCVRQISFLGWG